MGCNLDRLALWIESMDFQYAAHVHAAVMYGMSYMMKSECLVGEFLSCIGKESQDRDIKEQMNKIGSTFIGKREVSIQKAFM